MDYKQAQHCYERAVTLDDDDVLAGMPQHHKHVSLYITLCGVNVICSSSVLTGEPAGWLVKVAKLCSGSNASCTT